MILLGFVSLVSPIGSIPNAPGNNGYDPRWGKLFEQALNAAIVGGITFFSTLVGTGGKVEWIPALIAFGLAFLIRLAKDRKL